MRSAIDRVWMQTHCRASSALVIRIRNCQNSSLLSALQHLFQVNGSVEGLGWVLVVVCIMGVAAARWNGVLLVVLSRSARLLLNTQS